MALVHDRVIEEAKAIQDVCTEVGFMLTRVQKMLIHNSNQAIDWGATTKPAYIDQDAAGNLNGLTVSRQEVSNAIGSLDALRVLLEGAHIGNLNHLARSTTTER
jgi:hypothetical protein